MIFVLSDEECSEFKNELKRRFNELRNQVQQELLASNNERYIQLAGRVHDAGDESVADLLADVNLAIIDRHISEIQDVEAAIMRMARGTYGICIDCSARIPYERLHAYLTAKRCYQCQVRHEKSHPHPRRAGL